MSKHNPYFTAAELKSKADALYNAMCEVELDTIIGSDEYLSRMDEVFKTYCL